LAALPFLAFGLIWARNKQQEARRLEKEVAQRTQKIRKDKAVIEQQAAELRQLDTMKSRLWKRRIFGRVCVSPTGQNKIFVIP